VRPRLVPTYEPVTKGAVGAVLRQAIYQRSWEAGHYEVTNRAARSDRTREFEIPPRVIWGLVDRRKGSRPANRRSQTTTSARLTGGFEEGYAANGYCLVLRCRVLNPPYSHRGRIYATVDGRNEWLEIQFGTPYGPQMGPEKKKKKEAISWRAA